MEGLTRKQKGFVKDYLNGEPGVKAALNNYDTKDYDTAAVIASENLRKPQVINAIQEALPDELLAEKHLSLLEQTKIDYFVFPKYMTDEEIVEHVEDSTGIKVLNVRESEKGKMAFYALADATARGKALEMAYKLKGSFAADKHMNLNVDVEYNQEAAQEFDEWRKQQYDKKRSER